MESKERGKLEETWEPIPDAEYEPLTDVVSLETLPREPS